MIVACLPPQSETDRYMCNGRPSTMYPIVGDSQSAFSTRNHWWSEDQTLFEGGGVARLSETYAIPLLAGMSMYTSRIPDDRRLFAPVRQTHMEWWKTDRA